LCLFELLLLFTLSFVEDAVWVILFRHSGLLLLFLIQAFPECRRHCARGAFRGALFSRNVPNLPLTTEFAPFVCPETLSHSLRYFLTYVQFIPGRNYSCDSCPDLFPLHPLIFRFTQRQTPKIPDCLLVNNFYSLV